jgi:hypothetical protein
MLTEKELEILYAEIEAAASKNDFARLQTLYRECRRYPNGHALAELALEYLEGA